MQLDLVRYLFTANSTIGKLYVNDLFVCYIMEPADRGLNDLMPLEEIKKKKIAGETAIPTGTYELALISGAPIYDKFLPHPGITRENFMVPELQNVKDYEGILIHPGTLPGMTKGCNMPGLAIAGIDHIALSWEAFIKLRDLCFDLIHEGGVDYSIGRDPGAWTKWQLIKNHNTN